MRLRERCVVVLRRSEKQRRLRVREEAAPWLRGGVRARGGRGGRAAAAVRVGPREPGGRGLRERSSCGARARLIPRERYLPRSRRG